MARIVETDRGAAELCGLLNHGLRLGACHIGTKTAQPDKARFGIRCSRGIASNRRGLYGYGDGFIVPSVVQEVVIFQDLGLSDSKGRFKRLVFMNQFG